MKRVVGWLVLVFVAAFAFGLAPAFAPRIERTLFAGAPQPVMVVARGDLAADEAATIALFEASQVSVALISTATLARDPWNQRSVQPPMGSGSGFAGTIWAMSSPMPTSYAGPTGPTCACRRGALFAKSRARRQPAGRRAARPGTARAGAGACVRRRRAGRRSCTSGRGDRRGARRPVRLPVSAPWDRRSGRCTGWYQSPPGSASRKRTLPIWGRLRSRWA